MNYSTFSNSMTHPGFHHVEEHVQGFPNMYDMRRHEKTWDPICFEARRCPVQKFWFFVTKYRVSLKKRSLVIPARLEALGCSKGLDISQKHCQSSFFRLISLLLTICIFRCIILLYFVFLSTDYLSACLLLYGASLCWHWLYLARSPNFLSISQEEEKFESL